MLRSQYTAAVLQHPSRCWSKTPTSSRSHLHDQDRKKERESSRKGKSLWGKNNTREASKPEAAMNFYSANASPCMFLKANKSAIRRSRTRARCDASSPTSGLPVLMDRMMHRAMAWSGWSC
nr:hypothetical protein CFP56_63014 [Quercus suber]